MHSDSKDKDATNDDDDDAGDLDVEAEIKAEVQGMQDRKAKQTFTNVMLDIECGKHFSRRARHNTSDI